MSQLLFSICRNPKAIDSNASEGMDSLVRQEQAHKEQKLSASMSFYWLPAEGVAKTRGGFSQFRRSGLKVRLPPSKIWIRSGYSHFK